MRTSLKNEELTSQVFLTDLCYRFNDFFLECYPPHLDFGVTYPMG